MSKKNKKSKAVLKAVEQVVASSSAQQTKKKKKKKSFLKKALDFAGQVAPVAIPLAMSLLASNQEKNPGVHGSRNLKYVSSLRTTSPQAVPLSMGMAGAAMSPGIISQSETRDPFGKVTATKVVGQEFIGNLTIPANAAVGDVPFIMGISPLVGALLGTRLSNIAASYARWRCNNVHLVFSSSLAATQAGQIVLALLSDPQQEIPTTGGGVDLVRVISDSAGSDVTQVWSNAVAFYPGSVNVDPYYTNPLSSDAYLTSAGQAVVLNMIDSPASDLSCGSLFLYYEIEFLQPTLETFSTIMKSATLSNSGGTDFLDGTPLSSTSSPIQVQTDSIGLTEISGQGFLVPPGSYQMCLFYDVLTSVTVNFDTFTANNPAIGTQGEAYCLPQGAAVTQFAFWCLFSNTSSAPMQVDFSDLLVGVTGDTVQQIVLQISLNPYNFPAATARSPKQLALLNAEIRETAKRQSILDRETSLLRRIEQLERSHNITAMGNIAQFPAYGQLESRSLPSKNPTKS